MSKIIEEKSSSNKSVWGQISNIDKGMFLITLMNVIILQFKFLFPEEIKSIIKSYYHFILENFSAIMIILIIFVLASLAIFCFVKYSNSNKEGGKDILDSDLRVISSSILFFLFFNLTLISCSTSFSMNIVKGETNRQEISQDVVKKIESSICPRNEIPDSTWVSTTGTNNNESSNYFLQCLLLNQYNKFLNNSKTENSSLKVYCYPNNAVRTVLIPDNKQTKDTLSHSVNNSIIICNSSSVFAKREGVCDTLHSEQNKKSIHNNFIKNNTISLVLLFIQVISLFMILFSVFLKNNKNDQGGDKKCDDALIVSIFIASIAFSFVFPIAILATVGLYVFAKWFIHKKFDESLGFGVCFFPVVLIIIHGLTLYLIQGSLSYDYLISYDLSKISSKSLWEYIIPHITACVGWVTFWAFWAQLRANKIASIAAQKTSIENTFFKMIDIHRENLKEIRCSRGSSRHRVIINKEITGDTRQHIEEKLYYPNHDDFVEGKDAIKEICSLIFQCWENYKPNIKEEYDREKDRISKIKDFYIIYGDVFERSETNDVYKERYNENLLNDGNECHSALATYTFHLYRMVKYILRQSEDILSQTDKMAYMHILRGQMTREEQIFMFYNWFAGYQCMDASIEKKNGATTYRAFGFSWQEDQDHAKNSSKPQQFLSETKLIVYANLDYMIPELRYVVEKYRDKCNRIEFHDDTQKARLSASLRKNGLESEDTNFINTIYDNGKRLYRILKIGNSNSIDYPDKQTLETIISVLIK